MGQGSHRTRAQREAAGRALRKRVPRAAHAQWDVARARRDPVAILEKSNRHRLEELVPVRYGRMMRSPFAFLRGSAAVMAHDLAKTPASGLDAQLCGDCHVLNFGLFATPERRLVFDLNDFDETLRGPWEWDVKRLGASLVVAARDKGLSAAQARGFVLAFARTYREHLHAAALATPMEAWYAHLDWDELTAHVHNARAKQVAEQLGAQARRHVIEHLFPKISTVSDGGYRLVDQPPLVTHADEAASRVRDLLAKYRESLPDDRRHLLDHYRLEDAAIKVVGIGSVGTRCLIMLMMSADGDPLILQCKEAGPSVLEAYLHKSRYANHGERVVMGQRLMQSSSDIFLGWARSARGIDFYVRQLRDMKMSIPVEHLDAAQCRRYARLCGWALARAHAKSGDAASIAGYLGARDNFDRALARFSAAYADQTERDHAALLKAVRAGRIDALAEV
jgi:uncharacterized protein (DUF2252 family)